MSTSESISPTSAGVSGATDAAVLGGDGAPPRKRNDFLHYGLRNKKLLFGVTLELLLVLLAIIGPLLAKTAPLGSTGLSMQHPNGKYWLGTDLNDYDVWSQVTNGLRESYLVGAIGAAFASVVGMALGFIAGWRGGWIDEILQMITNVIVMIPALVLLVVIGSYLPSRSVLFEGTFIGLTSWPWMRWLNNCDSTSSSSSLRNDMDASRIWASPSGGAVSSCRPRSSGAGTCRDT